MSGVTQKFWLSRGITSHSAIALRTEKPGKKLGFLFYSRRKGAHLFNFCIPQFEELFGFFPPGTAMEVEITIRPTGEVME